MSRSESLRWLFSFILMCIGMLSPLPTMAGDPRGIAVIIHPDNPLQSLDKDQVAHLFLRKAKAFPGGVLAKPVVMPENSPVRDRFEREILRREPLQIRAYWARLVFTGRGKPPKAMPTPEDIKRYVAAEPAAISYLPTSEVDDSVKVVFRFD